MLALCRAFLVLFLFWCCLVAVWLLSRCTAVLLCVTRLSQTRPEGKWAGRRACKSKEDRRRGAGGSAASAGHRQVASLCALRAALTCDRAQRSMQKILLLRPLLSRLSFSRSLVLSLFLARALSLSAFSISAKFVFSCMPVMWIPQHTLPLAACFRFGTIFHLFKHRMKEIHEMWVYTRGARTRAPNRGSVRRWWGVFWQKALQHGVHAQLGDLLSYRTRCVLDLAWCCATSCALDESAFS